MKGCCFTGHRPEKMPFTFNEDNPKFQILRMSLLTLIERAALNGYDTFYNGGARGFDIVAAEIVLSLRKKYDIRLVMALPYRAQAVKFPRDWHKRYDRILAEADEVVYVNEHYSPSCFQERNVYMVDRSDLVIACYCGESGGTVNTIRYASRKGKKVYNVLDPMISKQ